MKKEIIDEFTDLNVSRQRKWQLRNPDKQRKLDRKEFICGGCGVKFESWRGSAKKRYRFHSHACFQKNAKSMGLYKGGYGGWNKGKHHTEETKKKISLARKGIPARNKGVPRTGKEKQAISLGQLARWRVRKGAE